LKIIKVKKGSSIATFVRWQNWVGNIFYFKEDFGFGVSKASLNDYCLLVHKDI
jgi:hypothetical protein